MGFRVGQRVRFTKATRKAFPKAPGRGVVVDAHTMKTLIKVRQDGLRSAMVWAASRWEPETQER